jgi:hypothetical protein
MIYKLRLRGSFYTGDNRIEISVQEKDVEEAKKVIDTVFSS